MKIEFFPLGFFMLISSNVFAASSISNVSKRLNFTSGVYKSLKGSSDSCVSGKYTVFSGEKGTLHMSAGASILASNLHKRKTVSSDSMCRIEYRTKVINKGFVSVEKMECIKPKTLYERTLKMIRTGSNAMEYSLTVSQSKRSKPKKIKCRLKLIKKI